MVYPTHIILIFMIRCLKAILAKFTCHLESLKIMGSSYNSHLKINIHEKEYCFQAALALKFSALKIIYAYFIINTFTTSYGLNVVQSIDKVGVYFL